MKHTLLFVLLVSSAILAAQDSTSSKRRKLVFGIEYFYDQHTGYRDLVVFPGATGPEYHRYYFLDAHGIILKASQQREITKHISFLQGLALMNRFERTNITDSLNQATNYSSFRHVFHFDVGLNLHTGRTILSGYLSQPVFGYSFDVITNPNGHKNRQNGRFSLRALRDSYLCCRIHYKLLRKKELYITAGCGIQLENLKLNLKYGSHIKAGLGYGSILNGGISYSLDQKDHPKKPKKEDDYIK